MNQYILYTKKGPVLVIDGKTIVVPSTKETRDCATEPAKGYGLPKLEKVAEYTETVNDYLHSRGIVPQKTSYEVSMNIYMQGIKQAKLTDSNLEQAIKNTEKEFVQINNINEKNISADITYEVKAKYNGKETIIPKRLYKPLTLCSNKSTITY